MRIYIIGNDGITLYGEAPATLNDGEIAVASNGELHAAPLSGKRLLALWNALPNVEKRRKVGDRGALIDQLWCRSPGPRAPGLWWCKHRDRRGAALENEVMPTKLAAMLNGSPGKRAMVDARRYVLSQTA